MALGAMMTEMLLFQEEEDDCTLVVSFLSLWEEVDLGAEVLEGDLGALEGAEALEEVVPLVVCNK